MISSLQSLKQNKKKKGQKQIEVSFPEDAL